MQVVSAVTDELPTRTKTNTVPVLTITAVLQVLIKNRHQAIPLSSTIPYFVWRLKVRMLAD